MPRETVYMLQTFDVEGKTFRFDRPVLYPTAQEAIREAEAARKAGVIVHEITGDAISLRFDDPIVLHTIGAIPVGLVPPKPVREPSPDMVPLAIEQAMFVPYRSAAESFRLQPVMA